MDIRKKYYFVAAAIIISLSLIFIQGKGRCAEQPPVISIPEPSYWFGNIESGAKTEHDFIIENKGGRDLIIDEVKASCGCTTSAIKTKRIAPNEKGVIHVVFDSTGRTGRQERAFTVYSNDPLRRSVFFFLNGNVDPSSYSIDPSPVRFEKARAGEIHTASLMIRRSDDSEFKVLSMDVSLPFIDHRFEDMGNRVDVAYIDLILNEKAPVGRHKGSITINTDVASKPEVIVEVIADVEGDIQVVPQAFEVGTIGSDNSEWMLILKPSIGSDVDIKDIFSVKNKLNLKRLPDGAGRAYKFAITPAADLESGPVNDTIEIHTNSPLQPVIEVLFSGRVE